MAVSSDPLIVAVERFKKLLAQRPAKRHVDSALLDQALAQIEDALRQHSSWTGPAGEDPVDMDRPLLPSPGVDRRKCELRDELAVLLRETRSLRNALQAGEFDDGGVATRAGAPSDEPVSSFTNRSQELVDKLVNFNNEEVDFVQESITADIGAGD